MGSHSVEPSAAPLTRRRLREAERTTDSPTEAQPGLKRPDPHSPVSVRSGSTPAVAPRTGLAAAAGPQSTPAAAPRGVQTPPVQAERYVSRPSGEPTGVAPARATRPQPTPAPQTSQPAATGRRAARAAAVDPAAPAPSPVTPATEAPSAVGSPSRRDARAPQSSMEPAAAPVRRARPRAQSSVAVPALPDRVTPSAAVSTSAPAPQPTRPTAGRPTSVLLSRTAPVPDGARVRVPEAPAVAVPAIAPQTDVAPQTSIAPQTDVAPQTEVAPQTAEAAPERATAASPEHRVHQPRRVVWTTSAADETAIVPAIPAAEQEPWELAETAPVATSQDAVAATPTHTASARRVGRPTRAAARLGVLGVLAGITVIVPVSQGVIPAPVAYGSDALADSTLPSTVTALAGSDLSVLPPASLVSADGALAAREVTTGASRNDIRSSLPGCEGSVREAGQNGQLKEADLCVLWDNHTELRADAAVSLAEFNQAFAARFGTDLCLSSGYRTLAEQRAVKAQKGGLAAAPGKSNHGWGLAVDLCQDQTSGAKWAWLNENGPAYGWANPEWAKPGGSGPHERWHWEYVSGVKSDGEYYDG